MSISEANTALEKLCGKSVGESTIKAACKKCGVDTQREMDCEYYPYTRGAGFILTVA